MFAPRAVSRKFNMEKQETTRRVLDAVGISERQIDLVGKILDLEKDKDRVHSINLNWGTVGYSGLHVQVFLLKNFLNMEAFKRYLKNKDVPIERAEFNNGVSTLDYGRTSAEFYVPESYPSTH